MYEKRTGLFQPVLPSFKKVTCHFIKLVASHEGSSDDDKQDEKYND
jgi:hypothetical protein